MENTKKIVLFITFLFCFGCRSDSSETERQNVTEKSKQKQTSTVHDYKKPIREHLYSDTFGNIYLKVKNCGLLHPSQIGKQRRDSIFLSKVFMNTTGELVDLKSIIDPQTFVQIDKFGSYYADSNHIYTYAVRPLTNQFFVHDKAGAKFLGCNKAYLFYEGLLYYLGCKIDGFQQDGQFEILTFPNPDSIDCIEFIVDKSSLYYGGVHLTKERLTYIEELPENIKSDLLRKYYDKILEHD